MDVARSLPPGYQAVPPTPGVALVRLCRVEGSRQAPRVTLLQSSGDASFDERILGRRGGVSIDEPSGVETCSLISALRSDPDTSAPTFDERAPPPPPPPPPAPPDSVAPLTLETLRVAGDKNIFPSDLVRVEISRSNKRQIMVPVKVCLDREGRVTTVKVMLSSGYMAYDADLINAIAAWRYRPFMLDGKPSPVCSAIQFVYRQHD